MRIFISAGEASGDMYGARLLEEIRKVKPGLPIQTEAVGGNRLKATGALMVADSTRWGAIGIFESLKVAPRIFKSYLRARRTLRIGEPGLFIPIDFGFMNIKLAKLARALEWKVLYFMPPGSWKRGLQGESLPEITDEVVTPFAWSSGQLSSIGVHAHWYGHPLKQIIEEDPTPITMDSTRIAVLPGSRSHEIKLNLKVIAKAAKAFPPGCSIEIAVASSVRRQLVVDTWKQNYTGGLSVIFTEGDTIGVLKRSRVGVICSGTATLEAVLCGCPMVVIYRVSRTTALEAKLVRFRPTYISLPNIVLNRKVVPELIHKKAKSTAIADWVLKLATDGAERENQLRGFQQIYNDLGNADAITRTASLVFAMTG